MAPYNKNDPQSIRLMFNRIAHQYDRTNGILSLQMHKRWNRALIHHTLLQTKPKVLLDLCCGPGAIAFGYLKEVKHPSKAFMLDFSETMLECARSRAKHDDMTHHEIHYLHADAQAIPIDDNCIDCATIAYGIRNVKNPETCLKDVLRVLRPKGTFGILELTQPANPLLRFGHHIYLRTVLPIVGKIITSDKEAYQYLCNSIHTFIPPEKLTALMQNAGFSNVKKYPLCGGIATIITGTK